MYVAGRLERLHPTLVETLCLVEGLARLGFGGKHVGVLVGDATEAHERVALLAETVRAGSRIVVVRLSEVVADKLVTASIEGREVPLETEIRWFGTVGAVPDWTEEEFRARWLEAAGIFLDAPASEAKPVWERSRTSKILPRLEHMLRLKGFEVRPQ